VGIDLRLIESYAVQRGFDLLAVETAEEVVVGLKEDWKERKELVSMAGKNTSERGRRKTKEIWNEESELIKGKYKRKK
jgi:hypothetical protein